MDEDLKEDFKKFKEFQKGKHCSIWGLKDVEDAFQAGYELRYKQSEMMSNADKPPQNITDDLLANP